MDCFEFLTVQNISKVDINQDFAQKYLEYLFHLMKLNKPIDFVQAALVMQTLSNVFAKKVDHLQEQILAFTVIFRKLELGNANINNEIEDGNVVNEGNDRVKNNRKRQMEKETVVQAFDTFLTGNNIRKSVIIKQSKSDLEIKKVDHNEVTECPRLFSKRSIYTCYAYDNKMEKLGRKDEFGVNGIFCNKLIPQDDEFCIPCLHEEPEIWINDDTVDVSAFSMDDDPMPATEPPIDDQFSDNEQLPETAHSFHEAVEEYVSQSLNEKDDSISGHIYFERMNQAQEKIMNMSSFHNILWTPTENNFKLLERKIKKKNVKSLPQEIKDKDDSEKHKLLYPNEYVLSDLMLSLFKLKSSVPLHSHFMSGIKNERAFQIKNSSRKRVKKAQPNVNIDCKNGDFRGFSDPYDYNNNDDNEDLDGNDLDLHHDNDVDVNEEIDNVEPCIRDALNEIQEYQKGFNHDDTINDIAIKVSIWHDSIRPLLNREETRTNFDIHEYGSQILNKFPATNAKSMLEFGAVVENQPREEIPRFFLSSLLLSFNHLKINVNIVATELQALYSNFRCLLFIPDQYISSIEIDPKANTYNVEISKDSDEELGVNDMTLTLLSRTRHHEMLDEGLRKELS